MELPGGPRVVRGFLEWLRTRRRGTAPVPRDPAKDVLFREVAKWTPRVLGGPDPRTDVCEAARMVAGAGAAWLIEVTAGLPEVRAGAPAGGPGPSWPFPPAALTAGGPVARVLADGEDRVVRADGPVRVLHLTPVHDRERVVGVLAVGYRMERPPLAAPLAGALSVLAAEAAVAMERADELRRLQAQARRDVLTGLPNRRDWDERLATECARAGREREALTVALLDLDHFKRYNDHYGHQAGDRLLKEAAASWRGALRRSDLLARWGGEEFAILLPRCTTVEAVPLLERVRARTPGGQTCSAGLAEWDGREDGESLVARADAALYLAKREGRDRTVCNHPLHARTVALAEPADAAR